MAKKKVTAKAAPEIGDEISRDDLNEMDHPSLVMFAKLNYGFNVSTKTHPREELVDIIMNAARKYRGNAEMKVTEPGAKSDVPPNHVKIRVTPGDYNPNSRPIPVGLNFRMATIPVNKDVVMHEKWLPCLQDAVETRYYIDRSGPEETLGWREQQKYPFTILERGPQE